MTRPTLPIIRVNRFAARLLLALLVMQPVLHAEAQSGGTNREREALRRAQQALQQANAQRDALQAEVTAAKAARQAEQLALQQSARQASEAQRKLAARLTAALAEADELRQTQARLEGELAEAGRKGAAQQTRLAQMQTDQERLQAALADSRKQAADLQVERDERTAANRALVARLEAMTAAQAATERQLAAMQALGNEAIDRLRARNPWREALLAEPLTGVAVVRARDEAERLQQRLDTLRAGGGTEAMEGNGPAATEPAGPLRQSP